MTTNQKMKHAVSSDTSARLLRLTEDARMRLKKRGSELLDDAQGQSERAIRNTRSWITKNPGAAVGYAFAAGVVLSAMLRRKKSQD